MGVERGQVAERGGGIRILHEFCSTRSHESYRCPIATCCRYWIGGDR